MNIDERLFERHYAEFVEVASSAVSVMPLWLKDKTEITWRMGEINRQLIAWIVSYMAAVPQERITVHKRWPADWWEAFKERWFPAWALARWPVRYELIDIDRTIYSAVCPHLPESPRGTHLQWLSEAGRAV